MWEPGGKNKDYDRKEAWEKGSRSLHPWRVHQLSHQIFGELVPDCDNGAVKRGFGSIGSNKTLVVELLVRTSECNFMPFGSRWSPCCACCACHFWNSIIFIIFRVNQVPLLAKFGKFRSPLLFVINSGPAKKSAVRFSLVWGYTNERK